MLSLPPFRNRMCARARWIPRQTALEEISAADDELGFDIRSSKQMHQKRGEGSSTVRFHRAEGCDGDTISQETAILGDREAVVPSYGDPRYEYQKA